MGILCEMNPNDLHSVPKSDDNPIPAVTSLGPSVERPGTLTSPSGSGETEGAGASFHRFHLETRETADVASHPSRFRVKVKKHRLIGMVLKELVETRGDLRVSLARPCVYGVFSRPVGGLAPRHSSCVGCLRCTVQYPEVVQIHPNPDRLALGDSYVSPDAVDTILYEARSGRVPVRGAGYRGAFGGEGWDGMWTDMSEIVRPTRDGIHGREFISTAVDVGSKPAFLTFDEEGRPSGELPETLALQLPMIFDVPPLPSYPARVLAVVAEAAARARTLAVVPLEALLGSRERATHLVPLVGPGALDRLGGLAFTPALAVLDGWDPARFAELRRRLPDSIVGVRVAADADVADLVRHGVRVIHLAADYHGQASGRHAVELFQEANRALIEARMRDRVTLIGSGGIVQAEHVAKAIICGLDVVALDTAAAVALQARFNGECRERPGSRLSFGRLPREWGVQRLVNLLASWRDQLLEIMGAMGLREVRRLRGELGRCMFQRDLEHDAFDGVPRAPSSVPHDRFVDARQGASEGRVEIVREHGVSHLVGASAQERIIAKHTAAIHGGFHRWPSLEFGRPPALGDRRWTADLILSTWRQAEDGTPPGGGLEYRVGRSGGGFDRLDLVTLPRARWLPDDAVIDTSIALNRRPYDRRLEIPVPWYGGGMSYGSVSEQVMLARARAARRWRTYTSTGEGGYPLSLADYRENVITQVATGMFGVREETVQWAPIVEFKYAQGAKPGLGGHLLGDKATAVVARMRESVPWVSLFSPFPFHSVYSVEDHKKHIDWIKTVNPEALVSVKVSTPTDVDMVAVGSYYAGAHIIHVDGGYGGTGAAPEIAKKNIAMPIELAIPRVHRFLIAEGIRDEVVLMASGGIRTADDIVKAIALGADGCILGTAELVALGCTRCSNCERGRGCPFGLTTTDPELSRLVDPAWGEERLSQLYASFQSQIRGRLRRLGLTGVRELRGRSDLLVYHEREACDGS
jgi:glutamate synthase domain-containing protein 2